MKTWLRPPRGPALSLWLFALGYLVAVALVSLYPFSGWRIPQQAPWAFLFSPLPRYRTFFDLWTNLLAYLPLGLVLSACLGAQGGRRGPLLALIVCVALSFIMEITQSFLPTRRAQWLDLLANSLGASLGCLLWAAQARGRLTRGLWRARASPTLYPAWFEHIGSIGLLLVWFAAQAAPMGIWLRMGDLLPPHWGLRPLPWLLDLADPGEQGGLALTISPTEQLIAEVILVGLGLAAFTLVLSIQARWDDPSRRSSATPLPWGRLVLLALGLSLFVRLLWMIVLFPSPNTPALSSESLLNLIDTLLSPGVQGGLFLAALLSATALAWPARVRAGLCMVLLLLLVLLSSGLPSAGYAPALTQDWSLGRWSNFRGVTSLAAAIWPALAVGWLSIWLVATGRRHNRTQ